MQVTDLIVPLTRLVVSLKALQAMMQALRVAVQKKGKAVKNPNRNGPPAAKREPKQNIKSQPSVFDVLPKKSPKRL
jgi:hypothetical protein